MCKACLCVPTASVRGGMLAISVRCANKPATDLSGRTNLEHFSAQLVFRIQQLVLQACVTVQGILRITTTGQ